MQKILPAGINFHPGWCLEISPLNFFPPFCIFRRMIHRTQGWQIDPKGFWVFAKNPKTKNPKTCHLWVEFINIPEKRTKVAEIRQDWSQRIRFQPKILNFRFWNSRIFTWECPKRKRCVPNAEQQITALFVSMPVVFFIAVRDFTPHFQT